MTTWYRLHHDGPRARGTRAFAAANAWSVDWGWTRVRGDAARAICNQCDGTGCCCGECCGDCCSICRGAGSVACARGYSACASAADLLNYFEQRAGLPPRARRIVEFNGVEVGVGPDGESLVVPDGEHARWLTASELRAIAAADEPRA